MDGTTFSEAMSLNKLVVSCTSEYDKALVSPVLSFIPTTNLPPCELLNATNSQAISYLSRMRSLNCTPDTSPAFICFNISSIILWYILCSTNRLHPLSANQKSVLRFPSLVGKCWCTIWKWLLGLYPTFLPTTCLSAWLLPTLSSICLHLSLPYFYRYIIRMQKYNNYSKYRCDIFKKFILKAIYWRFRHF